MFQDLLCATTHACFSFPFFSCFLGDFRPPPPVSTGEGRGDGLSSQLEEGKWQYRREALARFDRQYLIGEYIFSHGICGFCLLLTKGSKVVIGDPVTFSKLLDEHLNVRGRHSAKRVSRSYCNIELQSRPRGLDVPRV